MKKDRIIAIIGDSGCGKDELAKLINMEFGIPVLASYTTRAKRDGETDGHEHIFIDDDCFNKISVNHLDPFFAYTNYGGMHYFTTESQIIGGGTQIYIIDEAGIYCLKDKMKESRFSHIETVFIKIVADKDVRVARGVTHDRMLRDESRIHFDDYDITIVNNGTIDELRQQVLKYKKQILDGRA